MGSAEGSDLPELSSQAVSSMIHQVALLLATCNLLLCLGCSWVVLCRLNSVTAATPLAVRIFYVLSLVSCASSGLAPLFWGEWPGLGSMGMTLTFFAALLTLRCNYSEKASCVKH